MQEVLDDDLPSPKVIELQEPEILIYSTLRDVTDSSMDLRLLETQLAEGQLLSADNGGARHATAIISSRTLAVVRRKALLLEDVEARIASFQQAHAWAQERLSVLTAGEEPPPPLLSGIRKFIRDYRNRNGNPADANKSDFDAFAGSFRLPVDHVALQRLDGLAVEFGEWWADACLSEATRGGGHAELLRLFEVALGCGAGMDHPKLIRAKMIVNDRLAERVLADARKHKETDDLSATRTPVPPVGPASEKAEQIERDVQMAVAEGVAPADHRLSEAGKIAQGLYEADTQRKRLAAREKRLQVQAERGRHD